MLFILFIMMSGDFNAVHHRPEYPLETVTATSRFLAPALISCGNSSTARTPTRLVAGFCAQTTTTLTTPTNVVLQVTKQLNVRLRDRHIHFLLVNKPPHAFAAGHNTIMRLFSR